MMNPRYGKPFTRVGTALLVLVLGLNSAQARSLADILQSAELRVCLAPIHPSIVRAEPADCREDCTFSGAVYDTVLAFAAKLDGVKLVFRRVGWDEQFWNAEGYTEREASYTPALLDSGACDLYPSNLTVTAWRQKKLAFVPLFQSRMMVIVNKAQKKQLQSLADLAGKTAAVHEGTSFHTWLEAQNKSAYAANPIAIQLVGAGKALQAVDAGEVDFAITDADAAIWSTRYQFQNATVAFPVGSADRIGWAFRKTDQDLQAAVAAFFAEQKASGTSRLNQIWEQHFGVTLRKFENLVKSLP